MTQINKCSYPICEVVMQPETCPMTIWTVLHFWVGVLAQQLGFPGWFWFLIIVAFEIIENSFGIFNPLTEWATEYAAWPPYEGDSLSNSSLDVVWGMLGWTFGWMLDYVMLRRSQTQFWN
jgi:hypothetical protein